MLRLNTDRMPPMPQQERACLARIQHQFRRLQAAWARAAARLLLDGRYSQTCTNAKALSPLLDDMSLSYWIDRTPKPVLRGHDTEQFVSLSHQDELAMAVHGNAPVGCDIVGDVPVDSSFMKANFSIKEQEWVNDSGSPVSRRYRIRYLWGLKEALFKATSLTTEVFNPQKIDLFITNQRNNSSCFLDECCCRYRDRLWDVSVRHLNSFLIIIVTENIHDSATHI